MSRFETFRLFFLATVLGLMLFSPSINGKLVFVFTLIAIIINLALCFLKGSSIYDLSIWWQVGYIYFVLIEGIFNGDTVAAQVGAENYNMAATLLTGSLTSFLLGYAIIKPSSKRYLEEIHIKNNSLFHIVIAAGITLFLIMHYGVFTNLLIHGRRFTIHALERSLSLGETRSLDKIIIDTVISIIIIFFPALIAYYLCIVKKQRVIIALLLSLPLIFYAFLTRTRFVFGFSILGFCVASGLIMRPGRKEAGRLLILSIAILVFSYIQKLTRLGAIEYETIMGNLPKERWVNVEGVVRTLSLYVAYIRNHGPLWGGEISMLLKAWIPRIIWPDKPTLAGHWLIREIMPISSYAHTVSGSFAYVTFVDFGYHVGMILNGIWGVILALLNNKFVLKSKSDAANPSRMVVGIILATSLFAVRSLITAFIHFIPVFLFYLLIVRLFFVFRKRTAVSETTNQVTNTFKIIGIRNGRTV